MAAVQGISYLQFATECMPCLFSLDAFFVCLFVMQKICLCGRALIHRVLGALQRRCMALCAKPLPVAVVKLRPSCADHAVIVQDVMGLVHNLYLVLTNEQVRCQLQLNARQTAEQFTPVAIAERYGCVHFNLLLFVAQSMA